MSDIAIQYLGAGLMRERLGSGSSDINWVGIVYSLTQAIVLMLAGRLSDLFGRRWFFVIGSVIGLVGSIVGARAGTIGQLIAGETLIGIAAGFQCSFFWVVSEIVPMKRRFIANSGLFLWTLPTVGTDQDLCAVELSMLTSATRTFLDRRLLSLSRTTLRCNGADASTI